MQVKCINKKCLHKWDYRGQSNNYISCPICHFKFKIQRAINMLNASLDIPSDIPTNIPSDIPTNIPTQSYRKIESPKIEFTNQEEELEDNEEFQDQEELFPIQITKLCKDHNLPARYDDYDLEWRCEECIEEHLFKEMREFQNIADFVNNLIGKNPEIKIKEIPY